MKHVYISLLTLLVLGCLGLTSCSLIDLVNLEGKTYEADVSLSTPLGCQGGPSYTDGHYTITFIDDETCQVNVNYTYTHKSMSGTEVISSGTVNETLTCNYTVSMFTITIEDVREYFIAPCLGAPLEQPHPQKFKFVDEDHLTTIGLDYRSISNINQPEFTFTKTN